jgi:hypothetical protein
MNTPSAPLSKTIQFCRRLWQDGARATLIFGFLAGILAVVFLVLREFAGALTTLSIGLAIISSWMISRISTGLERQLELQFDPVTREVFQAMRENVKLARRLHHVDVGEKISLGEFLAGQEATDFADTFFGALLCGAPPASDAFSPEEQPINEDLTKLPRHIVFFESGSTIAYLGLSIARAVRYEEASFLFLTNNVLLSQVFLFQRNITGKLLDGTPIGQYGATFGDNTPPDEKIEKTKQYLGDRKKRDEGDFNIMLKDLESFFHTSGWPSVMVMTCSGFSLSDGPHVGSMQNRDFKEAISFQAKLRKVPIILVIYDKKIDEDNMGSRCLSVCGEDSFLSRPEEADSMGHLPSGITVFTRSILRGEVVLLVTRSKPFGNARSELEDQSGSAAYFRLVEKHEGSLSGGLPGKPGMDIWQSADGHVRLFIGRPLIGDSVRRAWFLKSLQKLLHGKSSFSVTTVTSDKTR